MSYRTLEEFKTLSHTIGECEISIMSSIRCFGRAGFDLSVLIGFQHQIKMIEMTLYSLMSQVTQVTVVLDTELFEQLDKQLETFKKLLKIAKLMLGKS